MSYGTIEISEGELVQKGEMARSIWIEYAGADYHVMARGNRREGYFSIMTTAVSLWVRPVRSSLTQRQNEQCMKPTLILLTALLLSPLAALGDAAPSNGKLFARLKVANTR